MRVITNHCNLRTFFIIKNFTRCKTKWWGQLSGLDMKIEYRPGKKNPADEPFWRFDYMDAANNKEEKTIHTVGYVTWGFIKREEAQKAIENACQTT